MTKKGKKKKSPLGSSVPPRYTQSGQWTRYMTEIDNVARKKKKKTPRVLRHPYN
ncbi:MAG: hypothetical protein ACTSSE_06175 [Candidatus Thorarchaeota archaeon]